MKSKNYPSKKLCIKLTDIGFPLCENNILKEIDFNDINYPVKMLYYSQPSVMELLDYIQYNMLVEFSKIEQEYKIWAWFSDENPHIVYNKSLPNGLAEMILWLHENNYITFK